MCNVPECSVRSRRGIAWQERPVTSGCVMTGTGKLLLARRVMVRQVASRFLTAGESGRGLAGSVK